MQAQAYSCNNKSNTMKLFKNMGALLYPTSLYGLALMFMSA